MGVYKKLLETTEDDVISKIAYTFYKEQKSQFINSLSSELSEDEKKTHICTFRINSLTDASIESYISLAQVFIEDFTASIMEQTASNYDSRIDGIHDTYTRANKVNYFYGVSQSVLGSFLFVILTGFLVFFMWAKDFSLEQIVKDIVISEIEHKPENPNK